MKKFGGLLVTVTLLLAVFEVETYAEDKWEWKGLDSEYMEDLDPLEIAAMEAPPPPSSTFTPDNFACSHVRPYHNNHNNDNYATTSTTDPNTLPATAYEFLASDKAIIFPHHPQPIFSVSLVTHNHPNETYLTLVEWLREAIANHQSEHPMELLIADSASTDMAMIHILLRLRNVKLKMFSENVFFGGGHNALVTCKAPTSKFTIYWNDDAVPQGGILQEYHRIFMRHKDEEEDEIGAVGCKLVWVRNGRLQEAGSLLYSAGDANGYGRGKDPNHHNYNFVRSVSYASGACLAVRNEVAQKVQHFDASVFPMYYGETDMAMKIWFLLGKKVIYTPFAIAMHHESLSTGDSARGMIRASRITFVRRWREELARHFMPTEHPIAEFCSRSFLPWAGQLGLKRILVIDDCACQNSLGSGFARAKAVWNSLAKRGHYLTIFPVARGQVDPELANKFRREGVEVVEWDDSLGPYGALESLISDRRDGYDIIFISRPHNLNMLSQTLLTGFPSAHIVYDTEALYWVRDRGAAYYHNDTKMLQAALKHRSLEARLHNKAHSLVVVSERERDKILAQTTTTTRTTPHIYALSYPLRPVEGVEGLTAQRRTIMFLGAFHNNTYYNGDAALHFVHKILPIIRETLTPEESPVVIGGSNPPPPLLRVQDDPVNFPNVRVGFVPSMREAFDQARVFVIPHPYAAGIPIKAFDAAAHGVPVVLTSVVNSGFGVSDEDGMLVCDDDKQFAEAVISLLRIDDLWMRMHQNLRNFHKKHHPDRFDAVLSEITDNILPTACKPEDL